MAQHRLPRSTPPADVSGTTLAVCDKRLTTVVLAMEPAYAHVRQFMAGIGQFTASHPGWAVTLNPRLAQKPINTLPWRPDGIIACTFFPDISRRLAATGVPLIELSTFLVDLEWCPLTIDEDAVGRSAAQHLLERGYQHLALVMAPSDGDHARARGFRRAVAATGRPCLHVDQRWLAMDADPLSQVAGLAAWLARAPRPLGLFCYNDNLAAVVATACHRIGASVPEEVGILGCDDDAVVCALGSPARSSLALPHVAMGRRAAELLARHLHGEPLAAGERFGPGEVTVRGSTDRRITTDLAIGRANAWIADNLAQPIGVDDVAHAVGLTRRTLERRMRAAAGCTVLDALNRTRLARAKELLRSTQSIARIAAQVGFAPAGFHEAFVRHLGVTPGDWRKRINGVRPTHCVSQPPVTL